MSAIAVGAAKISATPKRGSSGCASAASRLAPRCACCHRHQTRQQERQQDRACTRGFGYEKRRRVAPGTKGSRPAPTPRRSPPERPQWNADTRPGRNESRSISATDCASPIASSTVSARPARRDGVAVAVFTQCCLSAAARSRARAGLSKMGAPRWRALRSAKQARTLLERPNAAATRQPEQRAALSDLTPTS